MSRVSEWWDAMSRQDRAEQERALQKKIDAVHDRYRERKEALAKEIREELGSLPVDLVERYIRLRMNYENTSVGESRLEMDLIHLQLFARIFEKLEALAEPTR